ncbi:MAG: hypothetical protein J6U40_06990, partial [Kiritimatiellae bacterium]|nr:hypothetical protein [Kiritimatiellia bacterium]
MSTNNLYAPIFPVNIGELEVWWSKICDLNEAIRDGSGHVEKLSTPIFFPTEAIRYGISVPHQTTIWDTTTPQIVLASGLGSAGWTLPDHETEISGPIIQIDIGEYDLIPESVFKVNVPGGLDGQAFTIENWIAFPSDFYGETLPAAGMPWVAFYPVDESGEADVFPRLTLALDANANLWVNGEQKTTFTTIPVPLFHDGTDDNGFDLHAFHAALTCSADGNCIYYVNGMPVSTFTAEEDEYIASGDLMKIFPAAEDPDEATDYYLFKGDWRLFRLWKSERSHKQIYQNRYVQLDPVNEMLIQYGAQEVELDGGNSGSLKGQTLIDSSGNAADASLGYRFDPVTYPNAPYWIWVGVNWSPLLPPIEGRTFPTNAQIYRQNDPGQDGYNPNEEHAFMVGNVAYAMRCDLNKMDPNGGDFTSHPYVLVQYADPDNPGKYAMQALRVVPENDMYRFRSFLDAGNKIQSVSPLDRFQPANLHTFISGPLYKDSDTCFKDRKGWYWAHQAGNDGGVTNYLFEFSYPHQEQFDYPDGDAPEPGTVIGWMEGYTGRDDSYLSSWCSAWNYVDGGFLPRPASDPANTPIDYTFMVKWPDDVKGLYINDTLIDAKDGLPAIAGQLSVKIAYQQSVAKNALPSVTLIDPTRIRYGSLKELPDEVKNYREAKTNTPKFNDLPPYLRDRLVWNPMAIYDLDHNDTRELELSGKIIREISYTYAWLNVMDARAKDVLTNPEITPGGGDSNWSTAINGMSGEVYELADDTEPFDSLALTTTALGTGYVTLVMNDSTNEEMVPKSEVISMYVIKVVPELYNGYLHPILSDNPLDQQMNLKYTSDFGGTPENWEFEWKYCEPVNGTWNSDPNQWFVLGNSSSSEMLDWVTVGDAGIFGLSDHYIRCRYRPKAGTRAYALLGGGWSEWSTPCLAEGWIKRVLKAVNPFEQRIKDYYNTA